MHTAPELSLFKGDNSVEMNTIKGAFELALFMKYPIIRIYH